jgi:hypothetical protein
LTLQICYERLRAYPISLTRPEVGSISPTADWLMASVLRCGRLAGLHIVVLFKLTIKPLGTTYDDWLKLASAPGQQCTIA